MIARCDKATGSFMIRPLVHSGGRICFLAQLLLIRGDHLRCGLAHFKLGAHLLDLRGLLSELGCESLYLFLLLRDRCLQLLNFVIEHGLVLGARGR